MIKIRLTRVGRKHEPVYRIIVTDSRSAPRSGKYIEILGNYDPRHTDLIRIKSERVLYWIAQGAHLSGTVNNLLIRRGVLKGAKRHVAPNSKATLES